MDSGVQPATTNAKEKRPRQGKIGNKEQEDTGMTFGEKLLLLRRQSGLSQDQIVEKLDVSR